jgi:hypothetical protein
MHSGAVTLEGVSFRGGSAFTNDENLEAPYLITMPRDAHCCCTSFRAGISDFLPLLTILPPLNETPSKVSAPDWVYGKSAPAITQAV